MRIGVLAVMVASVSGCGVVSVNERAASQGARTARQHVEGVGRLELKFAAPVVAEPGDELCRATPVVNGID